MKEVTQAEYVQRVLRVERHLEQHLDQPVDPATLARIACFSLHHFHRIFRAQRGESVMQYVRRLRLERAARLVRHSARRLLDIALEAGYESHEAFTRAFMDRFRCPPSLYRRKQVHWVEEVRALDTRPRIQVRIVRFEAVPVFSMRSVGSYDEVGAVWQRLLEWTRAQRMDVPPLYGICPDDPDVTEGSQLRFDACVEETGLVADRSVERMKVPGGLYAVGVHVGPYRRLHETYLDIIGRWFPASGFEPSPDPVVEHYLDDPACVPEPELRTEVRVRIAE